MATETIWLRAARTIWWFGTPIVLLGWLLTPRESVIYVSHEPFSIETNTLRTTLHPVISELLAGYRVTGIALTLMVVITTLSHVRRTHGVRTLSLLLPTYVAAIEACVHFSWFGRRHYFTSAPSLQELRYDFQFTAAASVIAVAGSVIIAAVLAKWCREGVAGRFSWQVFCALAPLASVVALWSTTDRIFFAHMQGPG
jgi:hypothetical protein